jgi:hypothetical protein
MRREQTARRRDDAFHACGVVPDRKCCDGFERAALVAKIDEVRVGRALHARPRPDRYDALGIADTRWRSKEHRVDDADQRDDRPHPDGERQDDGRGESRRASEPSKRAARFEAKRVSEGLAGHASYMDAVRAASMQPGYRHLRHE